MTEATKRKVMARIHAELWQAGEVVLRALVENRLSGVDAGARKQGIDELLDVFARYAGLGRRMHAAS